MAFQRVDLPGEHGLLSRYLRARKWLQSGCKLEFLKAGFHMIADRRSQIAIRSAIVCDHMETTSAIVCDPAIAIADDRRR